METLLVSLPSEDLQELQAAVSAGEFETQGAALREAVQAWRRARVVQRKQAETLAALWDEGLASGDAGRVDFDDLLAEAGARLAAVSPRG